MKKGLIGTCNNISENIKKIKVWSNSFKEVVDGEVHLVCVNPTELDLNLLEVFEIIPHVVKYDGNETINNMRLSHTADALKNSDLDLVMITDVFDVMFQGDPFEKFGDSKIIVGSEGIYHNEEPWNLDVMQKSYPQYVELVRDKPILCSGVIGGKVKELIPFLLWMDNQTKKGVGGHDVRDQAAMNIKIYSDKSKFSQYTILTPKDGWVLHCAVGGPTQFYEAWGFKNKMKERFGEARNEGGVIVNGDWEIFDIVHQFNRIEEWNKQLTTRYI
jgi:hypothetical protein